MVSRLASISGRPKLSVKDFCCGSHAPSMMNARISSAAARQYPARSALSSLAAIFARRSQAAQHMTLENVCTRWRPRYSHSPASGWL